MMPKSRLAIAALAASVALPAAAQNAGIAPGTAFNSNTQNVANVLNGLMTSVDPRLNGLTNSVNLQTTPQAANGQLLALSPAPYSILTQLTLESLHYQDVVVRRYLRDVRQGGTEAGEEAIKYGTDRHYAMWLTGGGRTGDLKAGNDRFRADYGAVSATGGIDYRFARGTLLGVYGGYDEAQDRLTPQSEQSDAKTWFVGGYGSATVGPVYIDAHGSYGETRFNARRNVADGLGGVYRFDTSGLEPRSYQYQGAATAGISEGYMGVEVEPYVGAKYANVKLEGFSEGTVAGALAFPRLSTDSLESIAGLRLGLKLPIPGTQTVIRPSVRGEYRHEFDNAGRGRDLFATFSDGAGDAFADPFRTTPLPRDYAAVGGGFTVSGASPISFVVDYSGEVGGQRNIHGVTGGFHLAF